MDKVSIIIPVYNSSFFLRDCLESVLRQTYKNLEIVLVDDCSTDDSYDIIMEFSNKDNRVVPYRFDNNSGASVARNYGLSHCTGNYIGFVDSDDTIEPDYVEQLIRPIKEVDADVSICCLKNCFNNDTINEQYFHKNFVVEGNDILKIRDILLTPHTKQGCTGIELTGPVCKIFSRSVIDTIRFEEKLDLCEDVCFLIRCYDRCKKIAYINSHLYNRIVRIDSLGNSRGVSYGYRIIKFINCLEDYMRSHNYETYKINQFIYDYYKEVIFYYMTNKNFIFRARKMILECKSLLNSEINYNYLQDHQSYVNAIKKDKYICYMMRYSINRIFRK